VGDSLAVILLAECIGCIIPWGMMSDEQASTQELVGITAIFTEASQRELNFSLRWKTNQAAPLPTDDW
jgi:hypothetical protein